MSGSLARLILGAHRGEDGARGAPWSARPDHVVLDGEAGLHAIEMFLWREPGTIGVPLVCLFPPGSGAGSGEATVHPEAARWRAAAAAGVLVASSRDGDGETAYLERFAAPGKLALVCGARGARAGALAMLSLGVGRIEAAAALAGSAEQVPEPRVITVSLTGGLVPGVGGLDLAFELVRRLGLAGSPTIVEFRGVGVEAMEMRQRLAAADALDTWGGMSAFFPSDEITRGWMRAHGREVDWKRMAIDGLDEADLEIDLDRVEPVIAEPERGAFPRPLRHAVGTRVGRVVFGRRAGYGDICLLAAALAGGPIAAGTTCTVVVASRRIAATARASGIWETLERAGVGFAAHGDAPPGARQAPGITLRCGDAASRDHETWWASAETCAAAARAGSLVDPREVVHDVMVYEPARYEIEPARALEPVPAEPAARIAAMPRVPSHRGVILQRMGDGVGAEAVVPRGPRAASLALPDLVGLAFAAGDAGFVRRARLAGGGWLIAGREFLGGERVDLAAWVLAQLGVRVVIARGFAGAAERNLAQAGVLPLRLRPDADPVLAAGDELELPDGFDAIESGYPVTVRNLTRGQQDLYLHSLRPHEVEVLRAGGMLEAMAVS